jgi:hypothetical protein
MVRQQRQQKQSPILHRQSGIIGLFWQLWLVSVIELVINTGRVDKQLQRECFKFFDFIFSQLATDGKKWNNYVMK